MNKKRKVRHFQSKFHLSVSFSPFPWNASFFSSWIVERTFYLYIVLFQNVWRKFNNDKNFIRESYDRLYKVTYAKELTCKSGTRNTTGLLANWYKPMNPNCNMCNFFISYLLNDVWSPFISKSYQFVDKSRPSIQSSSLLYQQDEAFKEKFFRRHS